ncbi:hypothetical protein EPN27_04825 [Patescibacteria group bacterium]|nr:MAG: hypothetical protein EPN27_04825 [Patescibacteria group bacterium]
MGNFGRDNRFSRGSDRGGGRDFGRRDFGRPEMHKAVCSKCRKDCEVPFRPTGSKPVFCRDCFKSNDNFDANRSEGRRDFGRPEQPNYRDQFESLNAKLDRILKILTPVVYEKAVEAKQPKPENITVIEAAQSTEETIAPKKKVKKAKKLPKPPTKE